MASLPESILTFLARGVASSTEMQRELQVTQPTLSRALVSLGEKVLRIGKGRNTRYGLRRELPGIGSFWPLFSIDPAGSPSLLGRIHCLAREQYWFDAVTARYSDVADGLPFFLQDLRPQGFIGRTVSRRYPELAVPERINDWDDGHVLTYLSQRGEDCIGHFILGDESLQRFLKIFHADRSLLSSAQRYRLYPRLADEAIAGATPGSSAGGEHPKFTASLQYGKRIRHVLVKFSPSGTDSVSRRWADLLISEHLASRALHRVGITSAQSELLTYDGRMFLEVDRFDRTGERGRIGVASLEAIANHYVGRRDNWISAGNSLARLQRVSARDNETIRRVATFGSLIGNTDMHYGNLSFFFSFGEPLTLAPIYDMLPMLYAPIAGDQLPNRTFEPSLPGGDTLHVWHDMTQLAEQLWHEVASHPLISREFGQQAQENAARIVEIRKLAT